MKEIGVIKRIEEDKGVIQMVASNGCHSCGMNTYCHCSGPGLRELKLKLPGNQYQTGDRIEIETPSRSVLTAAFLVFILPLLLSIGAYFVIMSFTDKTGYGLLTFFGCFILAELLVAGIDRIFGRSRFFEPVIIRRLPPET